MVLLLKAEIIINKNKIKIMISSIEELINVYNNSYIDLHDLITARNKHKQEIKDAYNQGYREGQENSNLSTLNGIDVSQFSNSNDYYKKTFPFVFFGKK
jgi:hypothetical protein